MSRNTNQDYLTQRKEYTCQERKKGNLIQINPIDTLSTIRNEQLETIPRDHRSRCLTEIPLIHDLKHSTFRLLNARSVAARTDKIKDLIFDHKLDILALTETWLNDSSTYVAADVTPPGYIFLRLDRANGKNGGGVGIMCRKEFDPRLIKTKAFPSFEHCIIVNSFS